MKRIACVLVFAAGCSSSPTAPTPPVTTPPVSVTPPVVVTPPPTNSLLTDPRFNRDWYLDFAHGRFEIGFTTVLRRLTVAPRVFLNTHDLAGQPVDGRTLDTVSTSFISASQIWSGGAFGLAGIERGTGTRSNQPGWLTVIFDPSTDGMLCGSAPHGLDGGVITFFYKKNCGCNGSQVRPSLAKHELGHAFGFWHSRDRSDLMNGEVLTACDMEPSDNEKFHSKVAYGLPIGSPSP